MRAWACPVRCMGPAQASDCCICALFRIQCLLPCTRIRALVSRLSRSGITLERARRRMCGLDPRVTHTVNHNACACGIVKCTVKGVA